MSISDFGWVSEAEDLSVSTVDRYKRSAVSTSQPTKSNNGMSECNENIQIRLSMLSRLHIKVGLALLCTQHSNMYSCVHRRMQLCPQHIPQKVMHIADFGHE